MGDRELITRSVTLSSERPGVIARLDVFANRIAVGDRARRAGGRVLSAVDQFRRVPGLEVLPYRS